jgi:hypothetical protein
VWEERIFEPMRRMQSLQNFEVEANWMPMASSITGDHFEFNFATETGVVSHWDD